MKQKRYSDKNSSTSLEDVKGPKHIGITDINTDDLISKLVTLESKDLSKKRKRKSVNLHTSKSDSKSHSLVSSPIKVKSETCNKVLPTRSSLERKQLVPDPMTIKMEKSRQKHSNSSSSEGEDLVPRPKKIKMENGQSNISPNTSKMEKSRKKHSTSSSSEEEELVLRPIKMETEHSQSNITAKTSKKEKSRKKHLTSSGSEEEELLPLPIKMETKNGQSNINVKTSKIEKLRINHSTSSSSEEEELVPRPIKMETENGQSNLTAKTSQKEKSRKKHSTSSSSEEEELVPRPKEMKMEDSQSNITAKISKLEKLRKKHSASSSSKGEELVPRPKEMKMEDSQSNITAKISKLEKLRKKHSTSSSSEEEELVPRPIKMENGQSNITAKTSKMKKSRKKHSTSSSSEGEGLVPRPKIVKKEQAQSNLTAKTSLDIENSDTRQHHPSNKTFSDRLHISPNKSFSLEDEKPMPTESNGWKQELQQEIPELKQLIYKLTLFEPNAKYSLLRVPKTIQPNNLQELKCSSTKQVFFTLDGREYLFQPLETCPEPTLVDWDGLRIVNLEKTIVVEKSKSMLPLNNIEIIKRENISLPGEIKPRHPLFGASYKEKLSIDKKIKEKIDRAIKRKVTRPDKRKKIKTLNLPYNEKSLFDLLNFNSEDTFKVTTDKQKKKKKSINESLSCSETSFNVSDYMNNDKLLNGYNKIKTNRKNSQTNSNFSAAESVQIMAKTDKVSRKKHGQDLNTSKIKLKKI